MRFFEGSTRIDYIYGVGATAVVTAGMQRAPGDLYRAFRCNLSAPFAPGTRVVCTQDSFTGSFGTLAGTGREPAFGIVDTGNHCDDCSTTVNLPFPVRFYGVEYTSVAASSNGVLQFAGSSVPFTNACLPVPGLGPAIFVHWDDLRTDLGQTGIYTRETGVAPYRAFDIEWRAFYFAGGGFCNFSLRFFEGLDYAEMYYSAADQNGASATVGLQAGDERYQESGCNLLNTVNAGRFITFSVPPMRVVSPGPNAPPGATDVGNHCDDCVTHIDFPFPVPVGAATYTGANVSSNGNLQFDSKDPSFSNTCLPAPSFGSTVFAHWDDLRTDRPGTGIFTSVYGTAPDRAMVIEWRTVLFSNGASANFSVALYENKPLADVYIGSVSGGGQSATEGVQWDGAAGLLEFSCNTTGRMPGWTQYVLAPIPIPPSCPADWNQDSVVNSQDFFDFLTAFFAGKADFNADGVTNSQDFFDFITSFFTGC